MRERGVGRWACVAAVWSALACVPLWAPVGVAWGHPLPLEHEDRSPPWLVPMSGAVERLLGAEYLSAEELKDLRIRHGVWQASDLDTPQRAARAALTAGRYDDPAFEDPSVPVVERAEAMLGRGELIEAVGLLEGVVAGGEASAGELRVMGEALVGLGQHERAREVLGRVQGLRSESIEEADELAELVRAIVLSSRLTDPGPAELGRAELVFQLANTVLARARDQVDRLSWRVRLAEAELLYAKDNREQAAQALSEVLALNPSSVEAIALMGELAVGAFDFATAEKAAGAIEELAGPGAAQAAMVRARGRLRERDAQGALESLAPALARFPGHRGVLALESAARSIGLDEASGRASLARFEALSPGSALAAFEVGRALAEARQYERASEHLNAAADKMPTWAEPWIELGLVELQAGRDREALRALEEAHRLDPFHTRADNSLRLVRELMTYAVIETEHFRIRYKPGIDELLARDMATVVGSIHERVTAGPDDARHPGGVGAAPTVKTTIELMPDHAWFSVRITGMPRIWTVAAATGPVVAMESPKEGKGSKAGPYDWVRVLMHEYSHSATLARSRNRISHWYTEAIAVYHEGAPKDFARWQLLRRAVEEDRLFDLRAINIAFVRPEREDDRALAYAQANWMHEFILERWGSEAPLRLMDAAAAGATEEEAFLLVLGLSGEAFLEQFRPWAVGQLRAVGMLPAEGVPTIAELFERDGAGDGAAPAGPVDAQLEAWLSEFPDHPDVLSAMFDRAVERAGASGGDELLSLMERYARVRPVDDKPHRLLALMYRSSAERERQLRAIPHLEFMDERELSSDVYAVELAKLYRLAGDRERAWAKAVRAVRVAPFKASSRELAATIALERGDLASARELVLALTVLEPERSIHAQRLEAIDRRISAG